jgi:tetratricopeptide (TPR) repeat protein
MKIKFTPKRIKVFGKQLFSALIFASYIVLCGQTWATQESPIKLPKVEGSKSFDLEISQINQQGIELFDEGSFETAIEKFKKGMNLAEQLRDPSKGILYFNLALSLHMSGRHEEATTQFYLAQRFARGNPKILDSELLKMHECGFNPNIPCRKKVPPELNIEGSH